PEPEEDIRARCTESLDARQHYEGLASRGMTFGASLQGVRHVWSCEGEAFGLIELPDAAAFGAVDYVLHPALLDACLQVIANATGSRRTYLPLSIDSLAVHRTP